MKPSESDTNPTWISWSLTAVVPAQTKRDDVVASKKHFKRKQRPKKSNDLNPLRLQQSHGIERVLGQGEGLSSEPLRLHSACHLRSANRLEFKAFWKCAKQNNKLMLELQQIVDNYYGLPVQKRDYFITWKFIASDSAGLLLDWATLAGASIRSPPKNVLQVWWCFHQPCNRVITCDLAFTDHYMFSSTNFKPLCQLQIMLEILGRHGWPPQKILQSHFGCWCAWPNPLDLDSCCCEAIWRDEKWHALDIIGSQHVRSWFNSSGRFNSSVVIAFLPQALNIFLCEHCPPNRTG